MQKVVITDYGFKSIEHEQRIIGASAQLVTAQCKTSEEVIRVAADADALLVQWAPITAQVIGALTRCKVIVRYGIGVDNVDLVAARARGIAVCNVPDYGVNEVADHAASLALALARQLPSYDRGMRDGGWSPNARLEMPDFNQMTFGTFGFGRIARKVHERVRGFGFKLVAHDPMVDAAAMATAGAEKVSVDELFSRADILSLHCPLTEETRYVVNAARLATMKTRAVLVNTARGPLIDSAALCEALENNRLGFAGLDVFEQEPLPADHILRRMPRTILTPHVAWYSTGSLDRLQRFAAEEIKRSLDGKPLRCPV